MKKFVCAVVISFMLSFTSLATFAVKKPAFAALEPFGQVNCDVAGNTDTYTFSATLSDLSKALSEMASKNVFLSNISVFMREDGKAAVSLSVDNTARESPKNGARKIIEFLNDEKILWKAPNENLKGRYMLTSFSSNFKSGLIIKGQTLDSLLVFSLLMPVLENCSYVKKPFFQRGTFSATPQGRMLTFTVTTLF